MAFLQGGCSAPVHAADPPQAPPVRIEVADIEGSRDLASVLTTQGLKVVIPPKNMRVVDGQTNCVVWIGRDVPLDALRLILPEALRVFPHLKFFHVLGDRGEKPPEQAHRTVHIGGSIEAALVMNLKAIDPRDMERQLAALASAAELHQFLHDWNLVKAKEGGLSVAIP